MPTVEVNYQDLKDKVEAGWKKDALVKHYGLNNNQMSNLLRDCGLKIKRTRKEPAYKILGVPTLEEKVDETIPTTENIVEQEENQVVAETSAPDTEVPSDTNEEPQQEEAPVKGVKSEW